MHWEEHGGRQCSIGLLGGSMKAYVSPEPTSTMNGGTEKWQIQLGAVHVTGIESREAAKAIAVGVIRGMLMLGLAEVEELERDPN